MVYPDVWNSEGGQAVEPGKVVGGLPRRRGRMLGAKPLASASAESALAVASG